MPRLALSDVPFGEDERGAAMASRPNVHAFGKRRPSPRISKSRTCPGGPGLFPSGSMSAVYAPSNHQATRSGWANGWAVFGSETGKLFKTMVGAQGLEPRTSCV